ncbi:MAG TPA: HEAT repeat domain-containing protein [Pyrinomonadaceae bacterium]|nr:HEAT repeat domain-containing protein [Pyrinomonadaceae bacterium]
MKKALSANNPKNGAPNGLSLTARGRRFARTLCVSLLLAGVALVPTLSPFAQKRNNGPYTVTGVTSSQSGGTTVVSVSADAPLTRTQTWQDEEGFHMSLPGATPGAIKRLPKGVTVRNLGKSLEVVVAVKQGAGVTVDPQSNSLNLVIRGGVDTTKGEAQLAAPTVTSSRAEERAPADYEPPVRAPYNRQPLAQPPSVVSSPLGRQQSAPSQSSPSVYSSATVGAPATASRPGAVSPATAPLGTAQQSAPTSANQAQLVPATDGEIAPAGTETGTPSAITVTDSQSDGGILSYIFSTTGILILLLIGLGALKLARGRRREEVAVETKEEGEQEAESLELIDTETFSAALEAPKKDRRRRSRRQSDQAIAKSGDAARHGAEPRAEEGLERRQATAPASPALYGAYRVDQEVGKLVLGQAHRLDVLSSRAPDDRRALETSLIKAMNSSESGEDGRRRARQALEEYGFVARQCASLLLSHNAYDRASSARVLGEIGAQSSLPFLLEALYDTEMIVRTEAVTSLGALKMPSAIGALLDMARRHPEMPAGLVSKALSACTIECFDFLDASFPSVPLLDVGDLDDFAVSGEITHLDAVGAVEALPEWFEDEELSEALARLGEADVEARAAAARRLAQFPVQRSVEALTAIAANDPESVVRSAAVTSLGEIEHESVFAPVVMAFADEAREVRAAAARSLSRMSFDRAEGYARLIENADEETLRRVAAACIKAGMVTQAIDRMISEDRRLAYESFSLLSLLAKVGEIEPLLAAIADHGEVNVRLALIRLLGTTGQPEVATQLRHLAVRDGMPEKVRSALMEVVYKMDQAQPV